MVSSGYDGRVYCARLDGGEPLLLAQHEGDVRLLELTSAERALSIGSDAMLLVNDLSTPKRHPKVFASGVAITSIVYDDGRKVIVAGDSTGDVPFFAIAGFAFAGRTWKQRCCGWRIRDQAVIGV